MSWKWKVVSVASVIAVIAGLLLVIKYQRDMIHKQQTIEQSIVQQKQLSDNIIRAQAAYATKKDIEAYAKELGLQLKPIKSDLKTLDATVQGISSVRVITVGYQGSNIPSTSTEPNDNPVKVDPKNPDPYGYYSNKQILKLNEPFSNTTVPWGEVGFAAWKKSPWDLKILPREYQVINVLGQDEEGRHYVYNKFSITVDGKRHDIKINEAKFVEEYPKSTLRFAPRLYAGIGGGGYLTQPSWSVAPNLGLSLFSYGRTIPDPTWNFLEIGGGYDMVQDKPIIVVTPFSYNVGKHLPFVNNIFVGPSVSSTVDKLPGDFALMLGMSFGL